MGLLQCSGKIDLIGTVPVEIDVRSDQASGFIFSAAVRDRDSRPPSDI